MENLERLLYLFSPGSEFASLIGTEKPLSWSLGRRRTFMAKFNFGTNANKAVVSERSIEVLSDILANAGLGECIITSTSRTPADQARVMFDNIVKHGVAAQKALYAAAGDKVIDVYSSSKKAGKNATQIKAAMEKEIIKIGPGKVSRHCADPAVLNVVDIAPSSILNKQAFEDAVDSAIEHGKVSKFIMPPTDPAYHLEIPQG